MSQEQTTDRATENSDSETKPPSSDSKSEPEREIGGRQGPDPTRYGDWEKNGRCIDF